MIASAAGAPFALRMAASHSAFRPVRKASTPSSAVDQTTNPFGASASWSPTRSVGVVPAAVLRGNFIPESSAGMSAGHPEGSRLEVAVPYTPGAGAIFVPIRIVFSQAVPSAGLFRHGATYCKVPSE